LFVDRLYIYMFENDSCIEEEVSTTRNLQNRCTID
jgi:hypothetical protein